jgi:metal-dependent amidase/aminoacylase/carboxypeptidase family protein
MIQLFTAVGLWRQQLHPGNRVHGIIQEGGTAANIIPDRTRAWFMLRSPEQDEYERIKARFAELVHGAAIATGTTADITYSGGAMTMHPNPTLEERWVANAAAYGIEDQGPDPSPGSTDMGNVSWHCPTIHPELAIAPEGTAGHSTAFRDAAATDQADRTTLLAATLVAQVAVELFNDPELVAAAWRDFHAAG